MKTKLITALMTITAVLLFNHPGICKDAKQQLDFKLPAPEEAIQQTYLGVPAGEAFSLGQISADMVIVEIFSMYCPICQREASDVNTLFDMIRQNPKLEGRVKLLGIGAGNSTFEVAFFKKKYGIEFPLFSDSDFKLHKQIGEVGTPHFFGLRIHENDTFDVFYSRSGEIEDINTFLNMLLKKSGLNIAP